MRYLLAKSNAAILAQFARSKTLLAFDYDGTLAPIVVDRTLAVMRPETRHLLAALSRCYPCVVISGRSQADAKRLVDGIGLAGVVGNHGIEPWAISSRRMLNQVKEWRLALEKSLAGHDGIDIEDKRYSLTIHYRRSRNKQLAREMALRAVSALGDIRVIGGKEVVNVLPAHAPNKGEALERECIRFLCESAIYAGDDATDEDVFGADLSGCLLSVRVGAKRSSLAGYFIRSQREIDALMQILLDLRRSPP